MNEELIETCRLTDETMNKLRKIIFNVLYRNPPYNQGIIASEILNEAIPLIGKETASIIKKSAEALSDKHNREVAEARKRLIASIEKYVFYVDSRGYIALKPNATKNWLALKEGSKEAE